MHTTRQNCNCRIIAVAKTQNHTRRRNSVSPKGYIGHWFRLFCLIAAIENIDRSASAGESSLPAGVVLQLDVPLPQRNGIATSVAAFSPDGKSFAVLSAEDGGNAQLELRSAENGALIWRRTIGDTRAAAWRDS